MQPALVALDLDGTIVHRPGSVPWAVEDATLPSARATRAIRAMSAAGVAVVLASGRMFPGTRHVHEHLGLDTPLVCQQGCAVHEPSGAVRHETELDEGVAHEVVSLARELGHVYEWFTPTRYLASAQNEASDIYAQLSGVVPEYLAAPERSGLPPTGAGIISTAEDAPRIHAELEDRLGDSAHVLDFPSVTVCLSPSATKGDALAQLAVELGIGRERVVAVGDSVNDVSMLEWAGRGYAVSHGDRYALEAADDILDITDSDAVVALLERIAEGRPV